MVPTLILIDHGHYQFNSISIGFFLFAVYFALNDQYVLSSVSYILSLNHKHMSLYYAPAFFGHFFGMCLQKSSPLSSKVNLITKIILNKYIYKIIIL